MFTHHKEKLSEISEKCNSGEIVQKSRVNGRETFCPLDRKNVLQ